VPFEFCVERVLEQLRSIVKADYTTPTIEKRKFRNIIFAAVSLPVSEILKLLDNVSTNFIPRRFQTVSLLVS
ncbi:hypothetical protein U1Q18_052236, partial [Sarracenia purpurea var. burkii]